MAVMSRLVAAVAVFSAGVLGDVTPKSVKIQEHQHLSKELAQRSKKQKQASVVVSSLGELEANTDESANTDLEVTEENDSSLAEKQTPPAAPAAAASPAPAGAIPAQCLSIERDLMEMGKEPCEKVKAKGGAAAKEGEKKATDLGPKILAIMGGVAEADAAVKCSPPSGEAFLAMKPLMEELANWCKATLQPKKKAADDDMTNIYIGAGVVCAIIIGIGAYLISTGS